MVGRSGLLSLHYTRSTLYIQKYVDTPSNSSISATLIADRSINWEYSHAISIDKHWQENGLTKELSNFLSMWQHHRMFSSSSIATLTTEFQTASESNVSTRSVHRELHEMGLHGRAAAHKPKITMRNAKHRLEWCKAAFIWIWSSGNAFSGVKNHAHTIWQTNALIRV